MTAWQVTIGLSLLLGCMERKPRVDGVTQTISREDLLGLDAMMVVDQFAFL